MTDCIAWEGAHRSQDGRPQVNHGDGPQYVYRLLWEQAFGPLADGEVLHHLCQNAWCVNLDHLEPMTQSDHAKVHGHGGDWGQAAKTHCPQGHPYEKNTYIYRRNDGSTERHCRACRQDAKRRYRARKSV